MDRALPTKSLYIHCLNLCVARSRGYEEEADPDLLKKDPAKHNLIESSWSPVFMFF